MTLFATLIGELQANWTTVLIFLLVLLLSWNYFKPDPYKNYKLPPPILTYLPIIGAYYILLFPNTFESLKKYAVDNLKNNKRTQSLVLGKKLFVYVNKFADMKELWNMDDFSYRDQTAMEGLIFNGPLLGDGPRWKEQRRFALSALRNLGLGKNVLDQRIQEECTNLIDALGQHTKQKFNPKILVTHAVSNIICSMVFGHRFDYTDETFKRLLGLMEKSNEAVGKLSVKLLIPLVRYLPESWVGIDKIKNVRKDLHNGIFRPEYERHLKTYDSDNIDDFIYAYIHEMKAHETNEAGKHWFNEEELVWNIEDLFAAGTNTTSQSLIWCFLTMIHYPEVQKKVREEIKDALGTERRPTMQDRKLLPYTEATLSEIQRLYPIVIFLGHNTAPHTVNLWEYTLPPSAMVMVNLLGVHNDPEHWGDPENFRPERFIGPDGKYKKDDHLVTFSVGKHSCLGEGLARMELFLFFTSILQKFRIDNPPGVAKPPKNPKLQSGFFPIVDPFDIYLSSDS